MQNAATPCADGASFPADRPARVIAHSRLAAGETPSRRFGRLPRADGKFVPMSAAHDPGSDGRRTVSVLIPSWRRPDLLRRVLASLPSQQHQPDEVLVVVREDDAPSREVVAEALGVPVREVLVTKPGLVAARNAGLDAATGDIVVFLDDDAVPETDWLERMLAHYDEPGVGAVGGRDRVFHDGVPTDEGDRSDVGTLTWYGRFVALHHRGAGEARDVHHLKGVNMSFDRSKCPDIRVDTSLQGKGAEVHEDASVSLQVLRRGLRVIYDPAVRVDHFEASRDDGDPRAPVEFRARRDRQHNQTFVVVRYFPLHRAAVHLLFTILVGTSDAPGVIITIRNLLRTRTVKRQFAPFLANVQGRVAGTRTALGLRRKG